MLNKVRCTQGNEAYASVFFVMQTIIISFERDVHI